LTTIAYKAGVLAADTRVTDGGLIVGSCVKAVLRDDGHMAAGTGGMPYVQRFFVWFLAGEQGDAPLPARDDDGTDEGSAYIFRPDDSVVCFEGRGPNVLTAAYYADGSGGRIAMGALAAGAGAEEAVRIAIAHDVYSGGEVTVLKRAHG
jgi:20S proteasome alpha/beta subunit